MVDVKPDQDNRKAYLISPESASTTSDGDCFQFWYYLYNPRYETNSARDFSTKLRLSYLLAILSYPRELIPRVNTFRWLLRAVGSLSTYTLSARIAGHPSLTHCDICSFLFSKDNTSVGELAVLLTLKDSGDLSDVLWQSSDDQRDMWQYGQATVGHTANFSVSAISECLTK